MKHIKNFIEIIKGILFIFYFYWWIWLIIIVVVIFNYLISVSNLPDWFKFWLLK